MEIEFIDRDGIEFEDYTIRDIELPENNYDYRYTTVKNKAFQALLKSKMPLDTSLYILLKYYDKDGNFLGLDDESLWQRHNEKLPFVINARLNIPKNTTVVKIIIKKKRNFGIYLGWLSPIFLFIIIFIVIDYIIKSI